MITIKTHQLVELVPGQIWLAEYPIRYVGTRFNARMTVVRLGDGSVIIHSPCPFDEELTRAVAEIGPVVAIIAPGNFHYFHVPSCQQAFPDARTFICPGVDKKVPDLRFDELLGDEASPLWSDQCAQLLLRGTRLMREVVFLHRASKTLILVDLIENIGDDTPGTNWQLKMWWKLLRMWNKQAPAPEYRFGWKDKAAAGACLRQILEWDFERIVLAHGELITENAKQIAAHAWRKVC